MLEQFGIVLGQILTLILLMGVGFVLEKIGKLERTGTGEMSALLMDVVTPCVIVDAFQVSCDAELLRTLGLGTLAVAGCYGGYIALSSLFFRQSEAGFRAALRFGAIYGNVGFMGLPLVRSLLGDGAAIYAVLNIGLFNIFTWTHGVALMGGREAVSLKKSLLSPGILGVALGLPFLLMGLRLPAPLGNAVGFLADLNTPLAMVVIGAQMARADLKSVVRQTQLYTAAIVKLCLVPAITTSLLLLLNLDSTFSAATVILSAAPTAGTTAMFAERFHREPERTAQLVTLTTILSAITLPIAGVLVQFLF